MAFFRRAFVHCHRFAAAFRSFNRVHDATQFTRLGLGGVENGRIFCYGASAGSDSTAKINVLDENSRREMNKLLYRSKQRGFLELDLVLGKWVEENIQSLDDSQRKALVEVLNQENPDLWKWLTSQEPAPETLKKNPVFSVLHDKISKRLKDYSSPETRALPGQPWVRGWDDKRGLGAPVAGNQ
eukprot:TRINITY_DN6735_c0_g1_i1.p1 TRINITY_DN6735_c0_g1~~TRINITY_DN6735_c0_g1_i1.p1  ORF type:complete len:184 (-),score=32.28 TRINITY_DN6735_c0_g1_i1:123-674(-)